MVCQSLVAGKRAQKFHSGPPNGEGNSGVALATRRGLEAGTGCDPGSYLLAATITLHLEVRAPNRFNLK
jgi:hypothetical protein